MLKHFDLKINRCEKILHLRENRKLLLPLTKIFLKFPTTQKDTLNCTTKQQAHLRIFQQLINNPFSLKTGNFRNPLQKALIFPTTQKDTFTCTTEQQTNL